MTENDTGNAEDLRDPLTGCLNERGIRFYSQPLFALPDKRIGLVRANIDHFATIQDRYGCDAGDGVIQAVAYIFNTSLWVSDLVAHSGGEEFILLVQGMGGDSGWGTCERLRQVVEQHGWEIIVPGHHVTISIGLALRLNEENLESLFTKAGAALQRAEVEGRNCVMASE